MTSGAANVTIPIMSLTQLKEQAADLPSKEQRELIAFLIARQVAQDVVFQEKLAAKIDDRNPAHWMELDDAQKKYGE